MELLGVAEIAAACHVTHPAVSNWLARGKMPEPDHRLIMGPIWEASTILPFIQSYLEHPSVRSKPGLQTADN